MRRTTRTRGEQEVRFQFTHPGRGATTKRFKRLASRYVSIHAPREGCDGHLHPRRARLRVSIHAPREGCDGIASFRRRRSTRFNSRTPGGVRHCSDRPKDGQIRFQFTHPGRGATPHPRCTLLLRKVSIHAPREGCDSSQKTAVSSVQEFQFTHPGRGATAISMAISWSSTSFNSRTPGGVRLCLIRSRLALATFQFTHPGRGATIRSSTIKLVRLVSIHAPREGCDSVLLGYAPRYAVSIHAPREGCDS